MALTWTAGTVPGAVLLWVVWASARSLFVAGSQSLDGNTNYISTSPTGVTWTTVYTSTASDRIQNSIYSSTLDRFIGLPISGSDAFWSDDLVTWTVSDFVSSGISVGLMAWDATQEWFVIFAPSSANGLVTSLDGETWTFHAGPYTDDGSDFNPTTLCSGLAQERLFINDASVSSEIRAMASTDGLSWTPDGTGQGFFPATFQPNPTPISGVYYIGGEPDGAAPGTSSGVLTFDGSTWDYVELEVGGAFTPPGIDGTIAYCAVLTPPYVVPIYQPDLSNPNLFGSTNGTTWTSELTGLSSYAIDIVLANTTTFLLASLGSATVYTASSPSVSPNTNSSPPWQTAGQWALHQCDIIPTKQGPSR